MKPFKFLKNNHIHSFTERDFDSPWFTFYGVTPMMYNPESYVPVKNMLYRCIETDEIIQGEQINEGHPAWNYNN